MDSLVHAVRERAQYSLGYVQGRSLTAVPNSLADLYGTIVAKTTSLIALPLPLLSFIALPLFGGSTATVNLLVFYVSWSALVFTHGQLSIELYGSLLVRLFTFLLPALGFLAFDVAVPKVSKNVKARGERQLPTRHGRDKLLVIVAVAVFNVLLGGLLHAGLELLFTRVLHLRSLLKVTTIVPLPWTIIKDVLQGLAIRGAVHYAIHRFVLHTNPGILRTWHLDWQHSVEHPFSLVAAYDHPVNYLLANWLPTMLPAILFRWHVFSWFLFLSIAGFEELFVFSGYSVLPSAIILPGMARRTEAHFDSVRVGKEVGNFGHLGLIDFLLGTTCSDEVTIVDDVRNEAEKRQFQEHVEAAVKTALESMNKEKNDDNGKAETTENDSKERGAKNANKEQLSNAGSSNDEPETGDSGVYDGPQGQEQACARQTRTRKGGRKKA